MKADPFQFWSNFFSISARALRQMESTRKMLFQRMPDLQEISTLSRRMWGLDRLPGGWPADTDPSDPLSGSYPFPMKFFFYAWGLVPVQEYLSLVVKYEGMKEKIAAHEETIKHLRLLLRSNGSSRDEVRTDFQDVMKKQFDVFSEFMKSLQLLPEK